MHDAPWNSFGGLQGSVMLAHSLDNDTELGLEGSSTDKEAIDVGLGDQIGAVASVGRSTVLDSSRSGDLS